ncbi:terpene synthase family protein [Streptomyces chartreusis]|uniref:terpene synthase family protein n=1 Tax=Streptomyces chartreusis TaxID=1969 RepID=UPI003821469F
MDTFALPLLHMPFPPADPNPAAKEAEAGMWPWIDEMGLCPTPADRERIHATDISLLIGLLYPAADLDTLTMLARYSAWVIVIDDLFDERISNVGPHRCYHELHSVLEVFDGHSPKNPVARALADIWHWTTSRQGPSWQEAFRTHTRDAIWCHYTHSVNRRSRQLPHLEQYLEFRRDDNVAPPFLDMCEPATATDLPDTIRRLSAYTELVHSAGTWIGLCNDFYSLRKEREGGHHSDVFAVLQTYEGLSLQEAFARTSTVMTRCIERMQSATRQLLAHLDAVEAPTQIRADTQTCIQAYQNVVQGFLRYNSQAPRFTDPKPADPQSRAVTDLFRQRAG